MLLQHYDFSSELLNIHVGKMLFFSPRFALFIRLVFIVLVDLLGYLAAIF